jgi:hypothetical protein
VRPPPSSPRPRIPGHRWRFKALCLFVTVCSLVLAVGYMMTTANFEDRLNAKGLTELFCMLYVCMQPLLVLRPRGLCLRRLLLPVRGRGPRLPWRVSRPPLPPLLRCRTLCPLVPPPPPLPLRTPPPSRCLFLFFGSFWHDFAAIDEQTRPLRTAGSVVGASAEVAIEMQTRARSLAENPYTSGAAEGEADDVEEDVGLLSQQV